MGWPLGALRCRNSQITKRGAGERVAEVPDLSNLGDLWSKGRNKQAYHGTERQDIERQSSLHSSGLLSRLIRVLRKQGCVGQGGKRREAIVPSEA